MNENEALLVVERGPVPSTQVPLTSEQLTIGRSAGNDLVLADPEVSRRHVRIVRRADGFAAEDIGSTNGTFAVSYTHLDVYKRQIPASGGRPCSTRPACPATGP